jgi:DNA-binding response OmpR family regulator
VELLAAIADQLKASTSCAAGPYGDTGGNTHKVLVVEDDADIRQGLIVRLCANRYETVWAADAISAVSVAQREKPDLVILDLGLPAGDGFSVMDRLKEIIGYIPVIVLSAGDPALNRKRAMDAGACAFLQKPADTSELLAEMRSALLG